jgi:hypothetical protein
MIFKLVAFASSGVLRANGAALYANTGCKDLVFNGQIEVGEAHARICADNGKSKVHVRIDHTRNPCEIDYDVYEHYAPQLERIGKIPPPKPVSLLRISTD